MTVIQENAIFIADAHYPTHGDTLLRLLHRIECGKIETPQLFLMGDIFDLLVGGLEESIPPNSEVISLINTIARKIPLYYFEGNHDFCLGKILDRVTLYTLQEQPQYMALHGERVGLSHGDRFAAGWKHAVMNRLLRRPWVIAVIKRLKPQIVAEKSRYLATKDICRELPGFETKAQEIYACYEGAEKVIEGHYHQGKQYEGYLSLPSLACQKQVGIIRKDRMVFVNIEEL